MRTAMITFAAAILLGLMAAIGVFLYTANAEERVLASQQPTTVYVTTDVITAGTSFAESVFSGAIEETRMPLSVVPSGALSTATTGVALSDLQPGQIVMSAAFGTELIARKPITVAGDQMAVTVQLDDPQRVGNFLRPGSIIAVFNTSNATERETRLLLAGVTVLAVGDATQTESADDQAEGASTALVTVAVRPSEAERLIHAAQTGSPYLALLSGEPTSVTTVGVRDVTLYEQEQS
jgi:pilus assembly protein CpaB